MDPLSAVIVGSIQGLAEWLPISSEAQTMLYMINVLGIEPRMALSYAIFLHTGTMLAVVVAFRREFAMVLRNLNLRYPLTRYLVIATLATALTGVAPGGTLDLTLCVIDNKPRPFSQEELTLLADLGQMAGRELESFQVGTARLELADRSVEERKQLIDGVSGVWNRDGMLGILQECLAECGKKRRPATIILVELDIGAKLSGIWSGAEKDRCVAEIAQVLRGSINSYDSIGRTRDEQFAVLVRGLNEESASARVAEIHKRLDGNPVLASLGVRLHLGHTCVSTDTPSADIEAVFESARKSLARARRAAVIASAAKP
jgi:diguanylate cyclase (GGDEF)-like protein